MTIDELMTESHATAEDKGWWDNPRDIPEILMMVVSELVEALDEYRKGERPITEIYFREDGKPEGFPVEIADVFIRLADLCKCACIPLDEALRVKMDYNKTRPYRHGGKVC